jgi:hypothetical protein
LETLPLAKFFSGLSEAMQLLDHFAAFLFSLRGFLGNQQPGHAYK